MSIDEFWTLVEEVHAAAPADMRKKCELLEDRLTRMPAAEIESFASHFTDCYYKAYDYGIWGAAYLICGGCSDDGFMDFRSTLISLGRAPFEAALRDADSLADFDIDPHWARFEGYQYVPGKAWRRHFGDNPPEPSDTRKHPSAPAGDDWDSEEMTPRFPRLVAKYGHEDTDPEVLRAKRQRNVRFEEHTEKLRYILLNGVVPTCGLVPPPRIAKEVFLSGRSPDSSKLNCEWEPFDWDEGNYWRALWRLEQPCAGDLDSRPDLQGKKIRIDTGCGNCATYDDWMKSLKERGIG